MLRRIPALSKTWAQKKISTKSTDTLSLTVLNKTPPRIKLPNRKFQ